MNQNYDNLISISISTGNMWFRELYAYLCIQSVLNNIPPTTAIELPDDVVHSFRESKFNFFGLDLITVWKWAEQITTTVYLGRDPEMEQYFTNCIVLLYWQLTEYTQHNDVIVSMAIELPDVLHVTLQRQ